MDAKSTLFSRSECTKDNIQEKKYTLKSRINVPIRNQTEFKLYCIDDLISKDHKVRRVWDYVKSLDLSGFISKIQCVEGNAGRSATDPHLLLALWLYATIEGIMNGRVIEKYCSEHNAFIWLCGGVKVNYHTINDFRANNKDKLDELLTQTIAVFLNAGVLNLESISQDGVRVRAAAGTSSFRRKETLEDYLVTSEEYIKSLKEQSEENPVEAIKRKNATMLNKAYMQQERIKQSLEEIKNLVKTKEKNQKNQGKKMSEADKKKARISVTDPEARKMKMANGGYSPAYNAQLATDVKTKVIVGVEVCNSCIDFGLMTQMHKQVIDRTNILPKNHLSDGGYTDSKDFENIALINPDCKVHTPVRNSHLAESYIPKKNDSEVIKLWRIHMGTIEAKEMYKNRASTSEYVNAEARNRGLQQFVVRGLEKVASTMLIFAIVHNMVRAWSIFQ